MTSHPDVRARYDNRGKANARAVPMRWLAERVPAHGRYLDLFGGGLSAEMAVELRPDVEVVSAEIDATLHPTLLAHAAKFGYTALTDDFRSATGLFDLIYLDLTGNASEKSVQAVVAAKGKLRPDGALFVTISPDHEGDWAVQVNRPVTVAALLMEATGLSIVGLMTYRNGSGKQMVLVVLHGAGRRLFAASRISEMLERRGFWAGKHDGGMAWLFGAKHQRRRADPAKRQHDLDVHRRYMNTHPEYRAKMRDRSSAYYYTHREYILARQATPEYRAADRARQKARRDASRVMLKIKCGICGRRFLHHRTDVKWCSPECRRVRQRQLQSAYAERVAMRRVIDGSPGEAVA